MPTFEFNQEETREQDGNPGISKKTAAQLWIQHDFTANASLKKAPDYYE